MLPGYNVFEEDATTKRLSALLVERCPELQRCEFVVRAPGRVNLIGEHIDYSGYAVLPMALRQAVYIAVASLPDTSRGTIKILSENVEFDQYTSSIDNALHFACGGPPSPIKWYHYVLCGLRGFHDYAIQHFSNWVLPSLCLLVGYGDDPAYLPMNAGLSSSSALVVASAMAVMRASHTSIEATMLADICAKCETMVGTQGGGMDQAACLLANSSAILIEFTQPTLKTEPVNIPKGGVFCVADSGARLNKAATPDYNTRVAQCREAAQILLSRLKIAQDVNAGKVTLRDVQEAYRKSQPGQMLGLGSPFDDAFPGDLAVCLTRGDRSGRMGAFQLIRVGQLVRDTLITFLAGKNIADITFRLQKFASGGSRPGRSVPARRTRHCYSEAQRVLEFARLCAQPASVGEDSADEEEILRRMGELMNASHESCRELYDCSCPELDLLVQICRSAGSYGSRLTGAGWGGCVVSLVPENRIQDFRETVAKLYYQTTADALSGRLFFTHPGRAAGFIEISRH